MQDVWKSFWKFQISFASSCPTYSPVSESELKASSSEHISSPQKQLNLQIKIFMMNKKSEPFYPFCLTMLRIPWRLLLKLTSS